MIDFYFGVVDFLASAAIFTAVVWGIVNLLIISVGYRDKELTLEEAFIKPSHKLMKYMLHNGWPKWYFNRLDESRMMAFYSFPVATVFWGLIGVAAAYCWPLLIIIIALVYFGAVYQRRV